MHVHLCVVWWLFSSPVSFSSSFRCSPSRPSRCLPPSSTRGSSPKTCGDFRLGTVASSDHETPLTGITRGSDHSRWDWASHGGESPPLRGHHGHLPSGGLLTALNFTSSGFILSHSVVFSKYQEDESIHHWNRETLEKLDRSLETEKHKLIVLSMEGPRAQEKAECLMVATVHLLEDVMDTFHQPGVNEEARPQQGVHGKRMC